MFRCCKDVRDMVFVAKLSQILLFHSENKCYWTELGVGDQTLK